MIKKPYLIAEIGINHNGSLDITKKLIDSAKISGFDAVKFQKRTIDIVYDKKTLDTPRQRPWGKTTREQKLGLEFEKKEYDEIDKYCKKLDINPKIIFTLVAIGSINTYLYFSPEIEFISLFVFQKLFLKLLNSFPIILFSDLDGLQNT